MEKLFRIIRERSYVTATTTTSITAPTLQSKNSFAIMCEKKKDIDERKEIKEKKENVKKKNISQSDKEREQQKVNIFMHYQNLCGIFSRMKLSRSVLRVLSGSR